MNKFLEKSESIPLAYSEFQRIIRPVSHHTTTHSGLKGKKSYREIFKGDKCVVVYLPNKERNIGHWVCMIDHKSYVEFFDPYGKTYFELCDILGITPLPLFTKHPVIYNKRQYQKVRENINDCGRHVAVRCRFAFLALKRYQNFIRYPKCPDADGTVTLLTMLMAPPEYNFNKMIP